MVHITPREKLLLQLLAKGKTSPELASDLSISATDIDSALAELLATIGATSRAHAVAIAERRGLLEPRGAGKTASTDVFAHEGRK